MVNFLIHFRILSLNIALLGPGKNLKSFPLIAKEIKKKKKKKSLVLGQKNLGIKNTPQPARPPNPPTKKESGESVVEV